jgi:hypothetical protein
LGGGDPAEGRMWRAEITGRRMARHLAHRAATVQQPAKSAEDNRMIPDSYHCVVRSDRPNG